MRTLLSNASLATLAVVGAFALSPALPGGASAHGQEQGELAEIASTAVAVSSDEATLRIELADGDELEIRLEDGRVHLDDEDVGAYGSDLGAAWRELLGRVVTLEDGPLARALVDWQAPSGSELGARLDRTLEDALRRDAVSVQDAPTSGSSPSVGALLGRLLGSTDRLGELALALENLNVDELTLRLGEDVVVEADEVIDATLLVINGDVEIFGEVTENVIVVDGTLRMRDGSSVGGDVRVAEGRLIRDGGRIAGVVRELDASDFEARLEREVRDAERQARNEARRVRDENRVRIEIGDDEDEGFLAPLRVVGRSIGGGIAGIMETFVALMVLSVLGGLAVAFGRTNLEVVAETARKSPGRAAAVGVAGAFLTVPVWILGLVALCISIIGIPVALAWLPLFPLAVVAAAALGYFAVAQNAGEWVARRRYPYMDWVRTSNPYTLVVGGMVALMAAFFLANVVRIFGPWLGVLQGMLITAGVVITVGAALVGFGAVLLTRAGRRPEYYGGTDPFAEGWDWNPTPPPSGSPAGGPAGTGGRSGGAAASAAAQDGATDTAPDTAANPDTESASDAGAPGTDSADDADAKA